MDPLWINNGQFTIKYCYWNKELFVTKYCQWNHDPTCVPVGDESQEPLRNRHIGITWSQGESSEDGEKSASPLRAERRMMAMLFWSTSMINSRMSITLIGIFQIRGIIGPTEIYTFFARDITKKREKHTSTSRFHSFFFYVTRRSNIQ